MTRLLVVLLVAGACGDSTADAPAPVAVPVPVPLPAVPDPIPPPPPPEAIANLDAPPADAVTPWQAVIDRHRYLGRRGQTGAIYGRIAVHDGARYLIDESDGAGALAAVVVGATDALADGERAVARGSWSSPAAGRWHWVATSIARLPPVERAPTPYDASRPGHAIETIDAPPEGAIVIEELGRGGGGTFFQVIRGPVRPGDGWIVAGRSHWPPAATLILPGEGESYGGQDLRADSERWQLEPKRSYVVRVRRYRRPRGDNLPVLHAISPPKRVAGK